MSDMLTVHETAARAKSEGLPVSEYALRRWVKTGAIPCRMAGRTALLFWPNVKSFLTCEDGSDNHPQAQSHSCIRRVDF